MLFGNHQVMHASPDLDVGSAETRSQMGMVLDQFSHRVGSKIDNEGMTSRTQDAGGLPQCILGSVCKMQNHMQGDQVETGFGKGEGVHVAPADLAVRKSGLGQIDPRHRQHVLREINPHCITSSVGKELQHPTGPCPDIKQITDRHRAGQIMDCRLNPVLLDMQGPHLVPPSGVLAKIPLRPGRSFTPDFVQSLTVPCQQRVLLVKTTDQKSGQFGMTARGWDMKECPAAFPMTFQKARVTEQSQVTGNSWLTDTQNSCQFTDCKIPLCAESQKTKPMRLPGCPQHICQCVQ